MTKNKAIFLDRDGVINDNSKVYYVYNKEDFVLNCGVIEAIKKMQEKGYVFVIITNQGGVAKGEYQVKEVEILNKYLINLFKAEGIDILDIYYCPHHCDISKCLCRKPGSLLFEKAIAKYKIATKESFMIGDSERDIIAAEKAGLKGIKVKANKNLLESINETEYSWLVG